MILYMTRGCSTVNITLRLPATPAKISEAYSMLDEITIQPPTMLHYVDSPISGLFDYVRGADLDAGRDIGLLSQLAAKVEEMDHSEQLKFSGALCAESINGLKDVLRVAETLSSYEMISGVLTEKDLGRYLIESGYKDVPEAIRPYIDVRAVGIEFYADKGGAFCSGGYVVRRDQLPQCVQKRDAPDPTPLMENTPEVLSIELAGPQCSFTVVLPAEEKYLDEACSYLGVDCFAQAKLHECTWQTASLADLLPMDCISVETANELAWAVAEMQKTDGELLKFCSVLSVEKPSTFQEALELAEDLDIYERMPSDPTEYAMDQLAAAGAGDEILGLIRKYTNFDAMGKALMGEDGVVLTEFGAVRNLETPFNSQSPGGMQMV